MLVRAALFSAAALAIAAPAPGTARPPARGGVLTVIGNTSAARQCYDAAISPLSPEVEAFASCDHALDNEQLTPRDIVATHINRGILRVRSGQVDSGLRDFDSAIALDPTIAEAWYNRGVALLRTSGPDAALQTFNQGVERSTDRPALAYFGRAVAHEALGNVRRAYEDYRRASELDPDWDRPRTELVRFSVRRD